MRTWIKNSQQERRNHQLQQFKRSTMVVQLLVLSMMIQNAFAWSSISSQSTLLRPPIAANIPISSFQQQQQQQKQRRYINDRPVASYSRLRLAAAAASPSGLIPQLDKWKVLKNGRVVGTVSNHPTIDDGDLITTSRLKAPEKAAANAIVTTETGSKYRLGRPMVEPKSPPPPPPPTPPSPAPAPVTTAKRNGATAPPAAKQPPAVVVVATPPPAAVYPTAKDIARIKKEYELTGEMIGDDSNMYLLAGKLRRSTSGKSEIWTGYRADPNGLPTGEALTVKISKNNKALEREASNYRKGSSGLIRGNFVQLYDFFPIATTTGRHKDQAAIVIERGGQDLKAYLNQNGALDGKDLRDAAATAVQCLQGLHAAGLVWTDLKTENFVVCANGQIKGIDLESAMPHRGNPVDYSPEACPPEFAEAFLDGEGPWFELEYSYDIWSFGMYLYECATGMGHFDGKAPALITKKLKNRDEIPMPDLKDDKLKDLIAQCIQFQPKERPSLAKILLHPYFLSTGIGRFSW